LERSIQKYSLWLEELRLSEEIYGTIGATQSQEASMPGPSIGCPVNIFTYSECSSKIKKRKVQQLLES
jgi:hypothetical protein